MSGAGRPHILPEPSAKIEVKTRAGSRDGGLRRGRKDAMEGMQDGS